MNTSNNVDDPRKFDMGKMARGGKPEQAEPSQIQEAGKPEESSKPQGSTAITVKPEQSILESSDNAWLDGTRALQRSLILQLQDARASWWEGRLIGAKRQQVIKEVTEMYVMFLREEAKMTSDSALQARQLYLDRELNMLKKEVHKELSDMVGKSVTEIEAIFQSHAANIVSEDLRNAYAKYVWLKIFDLLGLEPPK